MKKLVPRSRGAAYFAPTEDERTALQVIVESPVPFRALCGFVVRLRAHGETDASTEEVMRSLRASLSTYHIKWDTLRQALTDCNDQTMLYVGTFATTGRTVSKVRLGHSKAT